MPQVVSSIDPPPDLTWPVDEELPDSIPEDQGISSAGLASAVRFAQSEGLNVHSITVVRNGRVVLDAYFYPFTPDSLHDIASCTKSITSTLVGIAIDKGLIPDVHASVSAVLRGAAPAKSDGRRARLHIDDLLTMRSGYASPLGPYADMPVIMQMMNSPNWVDFAFDRPFDREPGSAWLYCSPCSHLLAGIVQRVSGNTPVRFADANLFGPLGIQNYIWPGDPQGVSHGWGDLMMRPRDMAKIGMLMLYGGQWGGRQIVSREWVRAATTPYINVPPHGPLTAYGYQWWIGPKIGAYSAVGRGGQYITVIPSLAMVIVLTSNSTSEAAGGMRAELVMKHLIPAVVRHGAIARDPDGYADLLDVIDRVAQSHEPAPVPRPPREMTRVINGRTVKIKANPLQIEGLAFRFDPGGSEAVVSMDQGGGPTISILAGLDGVRRFSTGRNGLTAAALVEWLDDNTLSLDLDELGNISHWHFTLKFDDGKVLIDVMDEHGVPSVKLTGTLLQ